mmetsp:Transcript_13381/g.20031  ORF Transcript_13381/g.20031 Transcript_13381/m.20031 type:complete len:153 (+) Transcript_13381:627-1085(+)
MSTFEYRWWLLAREINRLRGTLSRFEPWTVVVDLFLYREDKKEEEESSPAEAAPAIGAPSAEAKAPEGELTAPGTEGTGIFQLSKEQDWANAAAEGKAMLLPTEAKSFPDAGAPVVAQSAVSRWGDEVPAATGWGETATTDPVSVGDWADDA